LLSVVIAWRTKTGGINRKYLGEKLKKHKAKYLKNAIDLALLGAIKNASQLREAYKKQNNK
jgi:hypothetical protein